MVVWVYGLAGSSLSITLIIMCSVARFRDPGVRLSLDWNVDWVQRYLNGRTGNRLPELINHLSIKGDELVVPIHQNFQGLMPRLRMD
jgi:hypothetical protein